MQLNYLQVIGLLIATKIVWTIYNRSKDVPPKPNAEMAVQDGLSHKTRALNNAGMMGQFSNTNEYLMGGRGYGGGRLQKIQGGSSF